jgi:hypothetical protein
MWAGHITASAGLTLTLLMSKKFGEWYQNTNKTEDTNKLTLLAFKIIAILHNTRLATLKSASFCLPHNVSTLNQCRKLP